MQQLLVVNSYGRSVELFRYKLDSNKFMSEIEANWELISYQWGCEEKRKVFNGRPFIYAINLW